MPRRVSKSGPPLSVVVEPGRLRLVVRGAPGDVVDGSGGDHAPPGAGRLDQVQERARALAGGREAEAARPLADLRQAEHAI